MILPANKTGEDFTRLRLQRNQRITSGRRAVFKFPISYSLSLSGLDNTTIQLNNSFDIVANGYHPVIFTAVDDDSVGVPLSSGSLFGNWYGNPDLTINCPVTASMSNLRFCYAYEAICFSYVSDSVTIAHSQIINSLLAIEMQNISSTSVVTLNNCLVANVPFPFIESWFNTYNITHCTFDNVSQFIYGSDSTSWDELAINNSIFSNDGDD